MQKSERNATIEGSRIILMLMVITLHYLYNGGVLDSLEYGTRNYILSWSIEALCLVAVNCYVLISAWFLSENGAGWRKALKIFIQVLFYSIGIYAVLCITGYQHFNVMTFVTRYLFPISSDYDWFATVYVVYVLLTPFLNIVSNNLDRKNFQTLLLILGIAFSVIPTLLFFSIDNYGVKGGYSLLWFVFLHFIAAYLRKFKIHAQKWELGLMYFVCCLIALVMKVGQNVILHKEYWDFYRYNSLPILIASVALTLLVFELPKTYNKFFCLIGSTTFGVLLIHTQQTLRENILWAKIVKPLEYCNGSSLAFWGHLIISVILIFIICSIIDICRIYLFKLINMICKKIKQIKGENKHVELEK